MIILVTGGLGFIGSHTVVELINAGHEPIIVDNLSNSKEDVLNRIKKITGITPVFYQIDVGNEKVLSAIFLMHQIDAVIHFAGLKSVNQSVSHPLHYYQHNLGITLTLLKVMNEFDCKNLIFSSSATVYGSSPSPVNESSDIGVGITNPYGQTKYMIEKMLEDLHTSDPTWSIVILRYFNPVGGHESGLLFEDPNDIPNNLMPYLLKVATKKLPILSIFGNDYPTVDGTGVRDFIHVVDLAQGHLACLPLFHGHKMTRYNLGTGQGTSVKQLVDTFQRVNHLSLPYQYTARRAGDLAISYADVSLIEKELGWKAKKTMEDICRDSWKPFIV